VIPFFAYPPDVRRVLYTTNAIESLHMQLRKITKNRGHFPSDEAATKLLYLALRNCDRKMEEHGAGMEGGVIAIRDPVRRSIRRCGHVRIRYQPASHTEFRTGS
jgi:putative transposase